ncbi:MAG: (d)CMP kinase [Bacteroidales bacterium]|nr:(d)CMP kinase [Bacteroidales bacterium]MBQ2542345.1 (d)CMP kinase [Bacteroidales bacterium]MBQ4009126.1 (d)CMP kinase [Bacteroidales bacterium]
MDKKITIAVDGFSSCGKSTLAKQLAAKLGYVYIDSGAMYRAVTLYALRNNMIVDEELDTKKLIASLDDVKIHFELNANGEPQTFLNGTNVEREIRKIYVSQWVSPVAAVPEVRHVMVAQQQKMGEAKGVVMDGRDIGTTVFPNAELKIFVTAEVDVRAQRRYDEMLSKGEPADMNEVKQNLQERDRIDQSRAESPLRKADDAVVLDNSHITRDEQLQVAYDWAMERIKSAH